jgi:hypothetical protein
MRTAVKWSAFLVLLLPLNLFGQTSTVKPGSSGSGGAATSDPDDGSIAAAQTNDNANALTHAFDGSVWRRVTFGTGGTPSTQVWTVQGFDTPSDTFLNPAYAVTSWSLMGCWNSSATRWVRCPTSTGGAGAVDSNTTRSVEASDSPVTVALQLIDDAQTGDSVHYRTSAGATEDEHEIKATAGRLFSIAVTNTNAAARYLRCYNLTAANTTPGTSTVFFGLAIPGGTAGAGFTHTFGPNGIAFSTALTCAFTTGAADTDVAEVAANEIKATYSYKD